MIQITLYVFYISDKDLHSEKSSIMYIEFYGIQSYERGNVHYGQWTTNSIHGEIYIFNTLTKRYQYILIARHDVVIMVMILP